MLFFKKSYAFIINFKSYELSYELRLYKMTKKNSRETVSLPYLEGNLIKNLKKKLPYGWFSNWVSEKIREEFFIKFEYKQDVVKVFKRILYEKTTQRNDLDIDIAEIAKQCKKLLYQKEIDMEISNETRKLVKKIEQKHDLTNKFLKEAYKR